MSQHSTSFPKPNDATETVDISDLDMASDSDDSDFWISEPDADFLENAGNYAELTLIGSGGMGTVFKAHDLRFDRDVAIKLLAWSKVDDVEMRRRFEEEAKNTASLQHPGVVPVYETGMTTKGRPFFSMKLIHGRTLRTLSTAEQTTPVQQLERLNDFLHVCHTIAYSHSCGILHLDLKTENVMLGDHGEVHVMDWGLSREAGADGYGFPHALVADDELPNRIVGTPAYMSPEQARGRNIGPHSDIFGLGAILCEILTGYPPFRNKDVRVAFHRSFNGFLGGTFRRLDESGGTPAIVALAKQCLSIDIERRPGCAMEVADRVAQAIADFRHDRNN